MPHSACCYWESKHINFYSCVHHFLLLVPENLQQGHFSSSASRPFRISFSGASGSLNFIKIFFTSFSVLKDELSMHRGWKCRLMVEVWPRSWDWPSAQSPSGFHCGCWEVIENSNPAPQMCSLSLQVLGFSLCLVLLLHLIWVQMSSLFILLRIYLLSQNLTSPFTQFWHCLGMVPLTAGWVFPHQPS